MLSMVEGQVRISPTAPSLACGACPSTSLRLVPLPVPGEDQ
jgi:hypothetical protein